MLTRNDKREIRWIVREEIVRYDRLLTETLNIIGEALALAHRRIDAAETSSQIGPDLLQKLRDSVK